MSSTCFEHPSVHPQEDLNIQYQAHTTIDHTAYMDAWEKYPNLRVPGSIPGGVTGLFSDISFLSYHGHGVDSAPGENEYQEHSWGWRRPVCEADLTTFMCRMSWKSGSLNLLELSGPHLASYGTSLSLTLWKKYHKITCSILPEDEYLDVRNMSKTL